MRTAAGDHHTMSTHRESSTMSDEQGSFQRCWPCGARRRVVQFGRFGIWHDGDGSCEQPEPVQQREPPSRQELLDDLFAQPCPFDNED
jgi:hypothetical protein